MRDKYCGLVTKEDIGKMITLSGWVFRRRDHGGLVFVDLRDVSGIVQIVFSPDISREAHEKAGDIKQEYVITITGRVDSRPQGTENLTIPTGEVEIYVTTFEVLNTCKPLPFQLDEEEPNESLRLRYRYLDMRREEVKKAFITRSLAYKTTRDYLSAQGFYEFETPMLTKSTPEGARDFIVPSRLNPGNFYALPQSPQLFKQLLMVGGFDRYFQIVRCFRDEDLRSDRQPEFTQVDIEMSFVDVDDVVAVGEGLMKGVFESVTGAALETPILRMSYDDAMELYGSDKPDMRFELLMSDLTDIFTETDLGVFKKTVEEKGAIKALLLKGKTLSRKDLDIAVDTAKEMGAGGLIWIRKDSDALQSPIVKYLKDSDDAKALGDVGIGTNTPVTKNIKGVTLRTALQLILRELGLTYVVKDEMLLVTTPEEAESELTTVVYPVTDLVTFRDKSGERWTDSDSLIQSHPRPNPRRGITSAARVNLHQTVNNAEVWSFQTQEVHHEIAKLLENLRRVGQMAGSEGEPPLKEKPSTPSGKGAVGGMGGMGGKQQFDR